MMMDMTKMAAGRWRRLVCWQVPTLACMALLAALTWGIAEWHAQETDAEMRADLLRRAVALARTINAEGVKELTFTAADRDHPRYRRLCRQMADYGRAVGLRSIYSMALRDGRLFFGPESLPEGDSMASPPGTLYLHPSQMNFEVFVSGEPGIDGPVTDEYGTFVTALAPVFDPGSGEVLMAVGVDVLADEWADAVRRARRGPMLMGGVLAGMLLIAMLSIAWRNRQAAPRQRRLHHLETFWAVVAGLCLTSVVVALVEVEESRILRIASGRIADEGARRLCEAVLDVRYDLATLSRLYESSVEVDAAEFSAFVQPMIQAMGGAVLRLGTAGCPVGPVCVRGDSRWGQFRQPADLGH